MDKCFLYIPRYVRCQLSKRDFFTNTYLLSSTTKRNYYEVLGLASNCKSEDIRKAYLTLSKQYHPDVNRSEDAQAKFQEINEAYSVLSQEHTRSEYDVQHMRPGVHYRPPTPRGYTGYNGTTSDYARKYGQAYDYYHYHQHYANQKNRYQSDFYKRYPQAREQARVSSNFVALMLMIVFFGAFIQLGLVMRSRIQVELEYKRMGEQYAQMKSNLDQLPSEERIRLVEERLRKQRESLPPPGEI